MDNIEKWIDGFRSKFPGYGDINNPEHGHCQKAAHHFQKYCFGIFIPTGWPCPVFEFYTDSSDNPCPEVYKDGAHIHAIVNFPECYIDWTARQYDAALPFPFIIWKKNVKRRKAEIGQSFSTK
jgi:hypothetical protein